MSLNRQEKAAKVEEVSALVAKAQTIVVAEYRGLDVDAVTKLRRQARSQGVQLRVLKNTLARRAVNGTPFAGLSDKLVGPLVYGFSADPVAAAKVLSSFAKDHDKLVVKGGAMANFPKIMILGPLLSRKRGRTITGMTAKRDGGDLNYLAELMASGKLKSVIDRIYPLRETADAIRHVETAHARAIPVAAHVEFARDLERALHLPRLRP